ncbi:uncharacterized protein NESG_00642 [Nematocida ausubeli]|uniref:Uncharacterized protein n=1 Tax=Nematocida ausubeli (strain ATCC PRA-371 / ERTm2) TaxID=1913371 RepID=H8ZA44_NEMA1|nr:uncharacterized protein NESG_00642 [Nematocida ausubeli]EHY66825.1 hypothetical protein NERG_00465 [Nematocida ausubeli]KAI5132948.1 hypothetical protein NEAUS06_0443 [Nematocida ausubeli]KFG26495.1 hypothetical protein NESG_00642 [Nematocida ausubeli]
MSSLTLISVACGVSVYSFISTLKDLSSVLLVDFECEYNFDSLGIEVIHEFNASTSIKDKRIIIINRIDSFVNSPAELQVRMNMMYKAVYSGAKVYTTLLKTKYNRYTVYIDRMIEDMIEYIPENSTSTA